MKYIIKKHEEYPLWVAEIRDSISEDVLNYSWFSKEDDAKNWCLSMLEQMVDGR